MAVIGWTTEAQADSFFSTHSGFRSAWNSLSIELKAAALTTSYNRIRFSNEIEIPSSPSPAILSKLEYAQLEYAGTHAILLEGGERRAAAISQGIIRADIVKESYDLDKAGKLPPQILGILSEFKTERAFYVAPIYRDEADNPDFDKVINRI